VDHQLHVVAVEEEDVTETDNHQILTDTLVVAVVAMEPHTVLDTVLAV
jgi:hypothetical protein